ncbi:response regulator [Teichococcus vastitatis]|uniref:response regulator n=1 Tax=Teichococcus vastitatis TaxID=2307076 RepID=UPI001EE3CB00|nr:response regulator [Pseudoroseomonas vastitatis]
MNCLLLVEDELLVRMLAKEVLEEKGFVVLEAQDGDEAIRMLDDLDRIDIVVTDVRMPGCHDGLDVAQHARTRFPEVPVIVATGFAANVTDRLKQLDPRAVLMPKPYSLDHMATLARTLSGSE